MPLHHACAVGSADCLALLLAASANVDQTDGDGGTALHDASTQSPDCLILLLQARATTDVADAVGETPLSCASRDGLPDCVQILLEYGASTGGVEAGMALMGACANGNTSCAALLIAARVDVGFMSVVSGTALHEAVRPSEAQTPDQPVIICE